MKILKTDKAGIIKAFPELKDKKNWWPIIPKDNAVYYYLEKGNTPLCFVGTILKGEELSVEGLYATKEKKDATAVFELIDWVGANFCDKHIKIYVINDIALWGWLKIGFQVKKTKKMKYWTAYWIERPKII